MKTLAVVLLVCVPAAGIAQTLPRNLALGAQIGATEQNTGLANAVTSLRAAPALRGYARTLDRVVEAENDAPRPRGAAEVRLFETASLAVVLVLNMDAKGETSSIGSGSLISRDGQIVTNWHVIASASQLGVVLKPAADAQN